MRNIYSSLAFILVAMIASPADGGRVWTDLYRIPTVESTTPQPPPLLLGCRFPNCFPGYRPQDVLKLEATASGPFLKEWSLDLKGLPEAERKNFIVKGDGQKLARPARVRMGKDVTIDGLRSMHTSEQLSVPVNVALNFVSLQKWFNDKGSYETKDPQLVLEIRQLVNNVEVDRWRFVYDFSSLRPSLMAPTDSFKEDHINLEITDPTLSFKGDHIDLEGYTLPGSPIVLLARGADLSNRKTDIFLDKLSIDTLENMTSDTPNVEVAVWAYDHQPILHLAPSLHPELEPIKEIAPGLIEFTPDLSLPAGSLAEQTNWWNLASCDYAVANHLFQSNRMGIKLLMPASPKIFSNQVFHELCDGLGPRDSTATSLKIFYVANQAKPQNCCLQTKPEVIFITPRSTPTSLIHELGHSFGLWDGGSSGNIMVYGALDRSLFTLQQVYLMVFGAQSTLNQLRIRKAPERPQEYCPSHCAPDVSTVFDAQCVDLKTSFPTPGSPPATDWAQPLFQALGSEEGFPEDLSLSSVPSKDLVQFLEAVGTKGLLPGPVEEKLKAIRASLDDQECPLTVDAYVELYRLRIVENSKLSATNILALVHTTEAKKALKRISQSASNDLKNHITKLLSQF